MTLFFMCALHSERNAQAGPKRLWRRRCRCDRGEARCERALAELGDAERGDLVQGRAAVTLAV
jgi:redox-regulated HSP33 family molecular chaperone